MFNFSFKGDTLYRLIPSGEIDLFIPRIVLWGDTISRDTGEVDQIEYGVEQDLLKKLSEISLMSMQLR